MNKMIHILLIYSDLVVLNSLNSNHRMHNYAKDYRGFFTRIISKVIAFTDSQYTSKVNDEPIGRIKYALA